MVMMDARPHAEESSSIEIGYSFNPWQHWGQHLEHSRAAAHMSIAQLATESMLTPDQREQWQQHFENSLVAIQRSASQLAAMTLKASGLILG